ncbi:ATP-binding protein [Pseudomonas viridiflava]|uniref:ATP-binding protein n=1 Tax=Pseudomonas viridiflava TaxID=33069 RepID=UPI002A6ABE72|nr:ATP-binding protein [Pseudomonas viridiflava]MDY0936015.1 ATP-binding protein [Pseudomonas viridiflava]MDY1014061.1 ATP-binding protein [Pseudomonas viridiflava]
MREVQNPPNAASLLESMRSIGYTLESALADLIDNSISAQAKTINIEFRPFDEPYIAVIDDGVGMSSDVLQNAMRHGSTSPLHQRKNDDMGRYGLGLKTSSLSQCRRLTVVSKFEGNISAFCWDLDVVISRGNWVMLALDPKDCELLPHFRDLSEREFGTVVIWQNLDNLTAGEKSVESALNEKMAYVHDHLSLVFHRFILDDNSRKRLKISLNGAVLEGVDPFWTKHKSTQVLDDDNFKIEGQKVSVKPYILPHLNKMTSSDVKRAGGGDGIKSQQGFYIYRNKRLIIWGTWFRLARKNELSKLARVRVDIPNSLDYLWALDIKKSAAHPPEAVRANLRRTVERIREVSGRTITFKGRKVEIPDVIPGWNEIIDRGSVRYDINRDHPLIVQHRQGLPDNSIAVFELLISVIENSFPADLLYSRMAGDIKSGFNDTEAFETLRRLAGSLFSQMPKDSTVRSRLLSTLHLLEPFNLHPELTKDIIKEYEL